MIREDKIMKDIRNKIMAPCMTLLAASVAMTSTGSLMADAKTIDIPSTSEGTERVYCVGSVSKVYVSAAAMQLADQGKLDIDAPLTDYIPDFKMADPRYKDITVRMLMNHTSGIMGTRYSELCLYGDDTTISNDEFIKGFETQRLKADPGEYSAYCNDGFELLRIVIENVSGMSYTDYVVKNIAGKIGRSNTGTGLNVQDREDKADLYRGGLPLDYEYCLELGAGGIYSTASDVAEFGSAFWKGDKRLLSESAKNEMASRWTSDTDEYKDGSGLGWDYVEDLAYSKQGVKVLGKGGDINNMHASLLVAPDNEISVCVLSSGGSSMYNSFVAGKLMDIALEEQGIEISPESPMEVTLEDKIPEDFKQYEGYYSIGSMTGSGIGTVTFSEDTMTVVTDSVLTRDTAKYKYTTSGGFVEVDDNGRVRKNQTVVFFGKGADGKVYIRGEQTMSMPGLGDYIRKQYFGEKMEAVEVSPEAIDSWTQMSGTPWVLVNDRYSSTNYDSPFMAMKASEDMPGYMMISLSAGSRVVKIEDQMSLKAFQTMPSSSNRDLCDGILTPDGTLSLSIGSEYKPVATLPELTADVREVELKTKDASWYRISDDMAFKTISVERPENSTICVYNKYFELLYTTHVTNAKNELDLPEGGYIVFLGEDGGRVKISG